MKYENLKDKDEKGKFKVERPQPKETDFIRLRAPMQNILFEINGYQLTPVI